jgi:hypothetical protein
VGVCFEYIFDNSPNRKMLRIEVEITNTSDTTLFNLNMSVSTQSPKLLAVQPNPIHLRDLRSREVVHQVLYLSEFSPSHHFIPLEVSYESAGGHQKQLTVPIATDISKFLIR